MTLEQLGRLLPLELADRQVSNGIYRGLIMLLPLWPRALYLQFWPRLTSKGRWLAGGLAAGLALPFAWLLLVLLIGGPNNVLSEKVLVRYPDGSYAVLRTMRGYLWENRLLSVRPLLWKWQWVKAADTNALPLAEQRRLRWYQRHRRR
ncbi:hypothetical protein GCM10028821_30440 [Hymenobacter jeollabukensis]